MVHKITLSQQVSSGLELERLSGRPCAAGYTNIYYDTVIKNLIKSHLIHIRISAPRHMSSSSASGG